MVRRLVRDQEDVSSTLTTPTLEKFMSNKNWPITTAEMANLCADALVMAKIVSPEQFAKVQAIIEEEIRVRISLGNEIICPEYSGG